MEANRAAALKNAYVLMSQHRAELAAAFFLLGEDISTAAAVCAKNLKDPQMGLLLCRVRDSASGGATTHTFITQELLPAARDSRDPWLAAVLMVCLRAHQGSSPSCPGHSGRIPKAMICRSLCGAVCNSSMHGTSGFLVVCSG